MKTLKILLTLAVFSLVCFAQNSIELINACKKGDLKAVKTLIRSGADINSEDKSGVTALMWAAKNGHLEIVKELLKFGTSIYYKEYKTAVCAIDGNNIEILKLIFEKICSESSRGDKESIYKDLLKYSIEKNKVEIYKFLISLLYEIVSDVLNSNNTINTLHNNLELSITNKRLEILKEIINIIDDDKVITNGIYVYYECTKSNALKHSLNVASKVRNNMDILKYLIKEGAPVNEKTKDYDNYDSLKGEYLDKEFSRPLINTVEIRDIEMMKELIKAGANVNSKYSSKTVLMTAISKNSLEMVKELIKNGADAKHYAEYNNNLIMWALKDDNYDVDIDIIEELIKAGVNVNDKNGNGETALVLAVKRKRLDILELLEKYGA